MMMRAQITVLYSIPIHVWLGWVACFDCMHAALRYIFILP